VGTTRSIWAFALLLLVACYPPRPPEPVQDDDDDDSVGDDDDDDDDSIDPDSPYYLANATVWTGSDTPLTDRFVVIAAGRVGAVLTVEPKIGQAVDVDGAIVLPGLIDANVLLSHAPLEADVGDFTAEAVGATLAAGVTTVVDTGSPAWIQPLAERIDAGDILGPRILTGGPIRAADRAVDRSYPCSPVWRADRCFSALDSDQPDPFDGQHHRIFAVDFSYLPSLPVHVPGDEGPPVVAWLERSGDWVAATTATAPTTRFATLPYVDSLPQPFIADVSWAATALSPHDVWAHIEDPIDGPQRWLSDTTLPSEVHTAWTAAFEGDAPYSDSRATWPVRASDASQSLSQLRANLDLLHTEHAGAPIPGSASGSPWVPHGVGFHHELALLSDDGPWDDDLSLLEAATVGAAERLELVDLGHLVDGPAKGEGRLADLLVVEADCPPWEDITCLATDLLAVIKGGVHLEGTRLEELRTGAIVTEPASDSICFDDEDCSDSLACDLLTHECRTACTFCVAPGCTAGPGVCGDDLCQERRGLPDSLNADSVDGVCRPSACEVDAPVPNDCSPNQAYAASCEPLVTGAGHCVAEGSGALGEPCDDAWPGLGCDDDTTCHRTSDEDQPVCRTLCTVATGEECGNPVDCVPLVPGGDLGVCS
jgi:hypothetical protein